MRTLAIMIFSPRRLPSGTRAIVAIAFVFTIGNASFAADLAEAEKLHRTGKYGECEALTAAEIAKGTRDVAWWLLQAHCEMAQGKYTEAGRTIEGARTLFPRDLTLHLFAHDVYTASGRDQAATEALTAVQKQITERSAYGPVERVALGRYLLANGTDAKDVLDQYFKVVVKSSPDFLDAHLAIAELALAKHDRGLAAETLQQAPKQASQDPRYHALLARAFADDDRARSAKAIANALAINPHHADSLLLRADRQIDSEDFAAAEASLKAVLDVDPDEPRAWAYRAVIAHLRSDEKGERAAREKALVRRPGDPHVEYLIGRKLSQDYRFKEGAAYQRVALEKDKAYLPAKAQLCQDLLRLGEETEGWKLAAEVYAADGYDVVAHNLVSLRDHLSKFRTTAAEGVLLRMDDKEADLYGPRAMAVLQRARKGLCEKYGVTLDKAVTVEIFPRNQDFAVRTFGMPGADGFLGVCFGPLITANSPASQGKSPSNWEAVLWHEFCHTVTLHKTHNKMPRWLSEGISVYEESRENSAWARGMTPEYREMILGDDFIPLSRLSAAFLSPKSGLHVQFAYFASALAVEYYVDRFGFDSLKAVLDDLGAGVAVNEALERRSGLPLATLDREYAAFARGRANAAAPKATWEKLDLPDDADSSAVRAWLVKFPNHFRGRQRLAGLLMKEQKWAEAEAAWKVLRDLYPAYAGAGNAYEGLATVSRKQGKTSEEAAALEALVARDVDAIDAFQRLVELKTTAGDRPGAAKHARNWLAVNPLTPAPHRALAKATEGTKDRGDAIAAYRAVIRFDVPDASDVRYRLAVQLEQNGERDKARREVLKSLEDAPRSRDALDLLLKLASPPNPPRPEKGP